MVASELHRSNGFLTNLCLRIQPLNYIEEEGNKGLMQVKILKIPCILCNRELLKSTIRQNEDLESWQQSQSKQYEQTKNNDHILVEKINK